MKIAIASDHAGFKLKDDVKKYLNSKNIECDDLGPYNEDSVDYPDYGFKLASKIGSEFEKGILICGSGIGISIAANRYPKVRAALVYEEETAKLSRQHNDSNVICLGGRIITKEKAFKILDVWFNTQFEGGRHQQRIDKLTNININ